MAREMRNETFPRVVESEQGWGINKTSLKKGGG